MGVLDDYSTLARTVAEAMPSEPPIKQPGTVTAYIPQSGIVSVRLDGDLDSNPAENLTGQYLEPGQRVMCEFVFPHGLYVVGMVGTHGFKSYSPELSAATTPPNLGSGGSFAREAAYRRDGMRCEGWFSMIFGTASVSAGSGAYDFPMPFLAQTNANASQVIGHGWVYDASANRIELAELIWEQGSPGSVTAARAVVTATAAYLLADNQPWTWAASDQIHFSFAYQVADGQ